MCVSVDFSIPHFSGGVFTIMRDVYHKEGVTALFSGVVPRTMWISIGVKNHIIFSHSLFLFSKIHHISLCFDCLSLFSLHFHFLRDSSSLVCTVFRMRKRNVSFGRCHTHPHPESTHSEYISGNSLPFQIEPKFKCMSIDSLTHSHSDLSIALKEICKKKATISVESKSLSINQSMKTVKVRREREREGDSNILRVFIVHFSQLYNLRRNQEKNEKTEKQKRKEKISIGSN